MCMKNLAPGCSVYISHFLHFSPDLGDNVGFCQPIFRLGCLTVPLSREHGGWWRRVHVAIDFEDKESSLCIDWEPLNQSIMTLKMVPDENEILAAQHKQRKDTRYHHASDVLITNTDSESCILPPPNHLYHCSSLALYLESTRSFLFCSHSNGILRDVSQNKIKKIF